MNTVAQHPLDELRSWLRASAARFVSLRLFAAKAREEVALDIAADAVQHSNALAAAAHSAETHDREAVQILDRVLADGAVEPIEIAELRRVRALTARSAETDHDIAEKAHVPAALS